MLWTMKLFKWIIMRPMNPIQLLQFTSIRRLASMALKLWRYENWTFKWNFAVHFYFVNWILSPVSLSLIPALFCSVFVLFVSFLMFILCFRACIRIILVAYFIWIVLFGVIFGFGLFIFFVYLPRAAIDICL